MVMVHTHTHTHTHTRSHVQPSGMLLDNPTIGVGKTLFVGRHIELAREKGSWVPLKDGDEVIGAAVRTRWGVKPVYVSVGHRIALQTAIRVVMACTTHYRLPETTREAHRLASDRSLQV